MDLISNPKIGFGRYPGFSLLFDNPGENSLSSMGKHFLKIDCVIDTEPEFELFEALKTSLDDLGVEELFATYRFFGLPPSSYHVTVFDGLNQDNLDKKSKHLDSTNQPLLKEFLNNLPYSLSQENPFTPVAEASSLVQNNKEITFEFEKLTNWGGNVLVARLKVLKGDIHSEKTLLDIIENRNELYRHFEGEFYPNDNQKRKKQGQNSFNPHISLGYFGNTQRGDAANLRTDRWTEIFKKNLENKTITFNSLSIYGFIDMANFFKRSI